jgi:hypothetical protein
MPLRVVCRCALAALLLLPAGAKADVQPDAVGVSGYVRIAARPDFQGGAAELGFSNLYGRLLNEGSYAALELRVDLLRPRPDSELPWASMHLRVEGGSIANADANGGSLAQYRVSQLYVLAGNVALKNVTFQVGTLDYYYGTLGLYDMRIAELLYETVGASARYQNKTVDLLIGLGDSGWFLYGTHYSPVLTAAASLRLRLAGGHLELGLGGQFMYLPQVVGDQYAPYQTPLLPGVTYADYARQDIVAQTVQIEPQAATLFPAPAPTSSYAYKLIAYLGFGKLGALQWDSLFANVVREPPQQSYTETFNNQHYTIYVANLTNRKSQINAGNEMVLTLIPNRLDAVWSVLFGYYWDPEDHVAVNLDNQMFYSTVLRFQGYITETVHVLLESSLAREISLNGNAYRDHADSVFQSTDGRSDPLGLQYGDSAIRDTWQLKVGPVLNPLGVGVFKRPSLRLLYGLQYSTANAAWSNSFVNSLAQNNTFQSVEAHWHSVIALEAEAWF